MVGITSEQIERVESILSGVQRGPEKVFFNVINRALDTVRTAAGRQIREVYAIKQKDLRAESNIKLKKASQTDLAGEIAFAGCKIPLYRFNVTPKQPAQGVRVKAAVLKSSAQTEFEHAFIARMQSGHIGMFERATAKHLPIDEFTGPSVAHMAGNSVVLEQVEKEAQETIDKRIDHEMDRILSGYGGKS